MDDSIDNEGENSINSIIVTYEKVFVLGDDVGLGQLYRPDGGG
jgi:hypothetical protein